jgi:hypothetical protein
MDSFFAYMFLMKNNPFLSQTKKGESMRFIPSATAKNDFVNRV